MDAISSYRGNRHHSPTRHRQDRLQYTVPLCLAHSVTIKHGLRLSKSNDQQAEATELKLSATVVVTHRGFHYNFEEMGSGE